MTSKKMGEKQLTNKNSSRPFIFTKTAHLISLFFCKKCMRRLTIAGFCLGTEIIILLETAVKNQMVFIFNLIHSRAKITLFIQHFRQVYIKPLVLVVKMYIDIACKVSLRLEFQVGYIK